MNGSMAAVRYGQDVAPMSDKGSLPGSETAVQRLQELEESRWQVAFARSQRSRVELKSNDWFYVFD